MALYVLDDIGNALSKAPKTFGEVLGQLVLAMQGAEIQACESYLVIMGSHPAFLATADIEE
jgi:hypothetical protein